MSPSSAPDPDAYRAPSKAAEAELRERGSRFLARLVPVRREVLAREELERVSAAHRSATHHCWAWRLGWPPRERSADAGEPAGTAGPPILRTLQGAGVSDCLLVVSRWFGGTKLGKGGLARAYAGAARSCLAVAELVERVETIRVQLELPYDRLGGVERLLDSPGVAIRDQSFAERVRFELEVEARRAASFREALADLGSAVRLVEVRPGNSAGEKSW
jgi:uncharacterized YigZ family protein